MPEPRPRTAAPRRLTLGDLQRAVRAGIGDHGSAVVRLRFRQHSALDDPAPGAGSSRFDGVRRFDADLTLHEGRVVAALLSVSGASGAPSARVHLRQEGDTFWYSVDGEHHGRLLSPPRLFDLWRFERRLDTVLVNDADIEPLGERGGGRTIVDAGVDADSFRRLLAVFEGDSAAGEDSRLLRSYSVALESGPAPALDYWWSLADTEVDDGGRPLRHTLSCHVSISVAPLSAATPAPITEDPELPALADLDSVWALTRSS